MKEKPKTIEKTLLDIALMIGAFIAIMLFCSYLFYETEEEIDARQYNEMIQYHQEQGKDVWSDGEYIIIKN